MTGEKKKRPIFTYIITILSAFAPTFFYGVFGAAFVLGTHVESGNKVDFIDLYFPAITAGSVTNLICAWMYFSKVRKRVWRPRLWINLLFILISYAAVPLFCLILGQSDYDPNATKPLSGFLFVETLFLSMIGFIVVARKTKKGRKCRKPRFLSPFWIPLAIPAYYILFLFTAMIGAALIKGAWVISGYTLFFIYKLLCLPFLSPATIGLVKTYLPGPWGNVAILGNALVWGTVVWFIRRERAKKFRPLESDQE